MTPDSQSAKVTSRSHRSRFLATVVILAATSIALLLAEVTVRIFLPHQSPDRIREHSIQYVPSAFAGYLLKPVNRLVEIDKEKAWGIKPDDEPPDQAVFVGDHGYRGPDFDVRKPEGTVRIIVLGGSAVFDSFARDTDTQRHGSWPNQIGERLRAKGYPNVEVINAGVPGHTSANSLARLYTQLWLYAPDIVLIYHGWNDFKFWQQLAITPETPLISRYAVYDPYEDPFIHYQGKIDRFLSGSQLYSALRMYYYQWALRPGSEGKLPDIENLAPGFSDYGPRQFRLTMEMFVSACRTIGAEPVFVTQATLVTVDNTAKERQRIGYRYQLLNHDAIIDAYERSYAIMRNISTNTGAHFIDAAATMNGRGEFFTDHVHTTVAGSTHLADIVTAGLLEREHLLTN